MHRLRLAVIPGDGIGPELAEVCQPVIEAAAAREDLELETSVLDWGGARYLRQGAAMPADAAGQLRRHDAVLFGAVGRPDVPDHELVWGLIIRLRQELQLSINLRPARSFPAVRGPLAGRPSIDLLVVRENTEGEYVGAGGVAHRGAPEEVALELAVHSRQVILDAARFAFTAARDRRRQLTLVTKSNAMRFGYVLWDQVFEEVAAEYPEVTTERVLVDAMAARMVERPQGLDVLLCSNLFGDILSDLAAALVGGLGLAPSANIRPDQALGVFEPVHGSAPDIAGRGLANPCGYLLSAAMLFEHNRLPRAAAALRAGIASALTEPANHTPDLGGSASTAELAQAVRDRLQEASV